VARLVFILLFIALLWPNTFLINTDGADLSILLDSPVLFLWDCVDIILLADPFLLVICIEVTLLALLKRVWIWWLLHLPFYLWLPLELGYLHRYSSPSSAHILSILSETNFNEAAGYLGSTGLALCVLYLFWMVLVVWLTFFFRRKDLQWKHRSRVWVAAVFVPVLAIYFYGFKDIDNAKAKLADIDGDLTSYRFSYGLSGYIDSYPFGLPLRVYDYFHQMQVLKHYASELRAVRLDIDRDKRLEGEEENYVVVIGESSRAGNWSINGYSRETTPLLQASENLISFSDAVSATSATRTAVPIMLSQTKANDLVFSRFKPSWMSAFKEKGFKVYWFSTQMPVGTHDTTIGIYADLADEVKYLNAGTYKNITEYDGVLLGAVQSALSDKSRKRLIILHTLGSHTPYQRRYPEQYTKFLPAPSKESLPNIFNSKDREVIINSYDNSIYYTDYVLDQVIGSLKKANGIKALWYASDHGQSLYDPGCSGAGHGFFSRYNFHIPVVFWYSSEYLAMFPEKAAGLASNQKKPVYMGDFYSTVLDSLGFDVDQSVKKKSFSERSYEGSERVVTVDGGKLVDYDKEFTHAACWK
jgi:glucan phosphoethanolaminetransferase (alkaline phosphatase superfamily)